MANLIVPIAIGLCCWVPLLPGVPRPNYKTLLRALIANGAFWIALMVLCGWLFPRFYGPSERQYEWNYGLILVQVSMRLSFFFSVIAVFIGPILLWVEWRLYRLAPSPRDRSHLRADAILVVAYIACFITFVQIW